MASPSARPDLASVTLVAVTSVAIEGTMVEALRRVDGAGEFRAVLLLSDCEPDASRMRAIEWRKIDRSARARITRVSCCANSRPHHAPPMRCASSGTASFLAAMPGTRPSSTIDYIGAPWPHFRDGHNVGNGGFSLRSRRLLEACRELPFDVRSWKMCSFAASGALSSSSKASALRRRRSRGASPTNGPCLRETNSASTAPSISCDTCPPADALRLFRSLEPRDAGEERALGVAWLGAAAGARCASPSRCSAGSRDSLPQAALGGHPDASSVMYSSTYRA